MSEPGIHKGWPHRLGNLWRLVVGWALIAAGLLGLVLPIIPGIPLLIGGLVMLSSQYHWAHASVVWMKSKFHKTGVASGQESASRRPPPRRSDPDPEL